MQEMYFRYFPAFVERIIDTSRISVWLQHPNNPHIHYSSKLTITVDLAKTPSNKHIPWEDVEIDDYSNHLIPSARGFTTLGPLVPHLYASAGVYLSESYIYRHLKQIRRARKDAESDVPTDQAISAVVMAGRFYENIALVQRTANTVRHFHGFYRRPDFKPSSDLPALHLLSHAGYSRESRAPRGILLSDSDVAVPKKPIPRWMAFDHPEYGAPKILTEDAIFVSLNIARDSNLDVPKRPSGSGEGKAYKRVSAEAPLTPAPGGPLNVISSDAYDEVARIFHKLTPNCLLTSNYDLATKLSALSGPYTSIDLIAHSRRDGVLKLNEIPLSRHLSHHVFTSTVIQHLRRLEIRQIRLLGCRTACSPEARAAIRALHTLVNPNWTTEPMIQVIGTRSDLFAVHYAEQFGFEDARLLVDPAIALDGSVGDCPPGDDDGQAPSSPAPSTLLTRIDELPLERTTLTAARVHLRHVFDDRSWAEFLSLIDLNSRRTDDTPLEEALGRVYVVDGNVVRSIDIVPERPHGAPDVSPVKVSRVRLNYDDAWISYAIKPLPVRDQQTVADVLLQLLTSKMSL